MDVDVPTYGVNGAQGIPADRMTCDWCGKDLKWKADDAGERRQDYGLEGKRWGMFHACPGCTAKASRMEWLCAEKIGGVNAYLTQCREDGIDVGDGPLLTIEAEGRPIVKLDDAKAARDYLKTITPKRKGGGGRKRAAKVKAPLTPRGLVDERKRLERELARVNGELASAGKSIGPAALGKLLGVSRQAAWSFMRTAS